MSSSPRHGTCCARALLERHGSRSDTGARHKDQNGFSYASSLRRVGDQDGEKPFCRWSHPFVWSLRSHPSAPAARSIRRRVEWRSRTREYRAPVGLVLDGHEHGGRMAANGAMRRGHARYRSIPARTWLGAAVDGGGRQVRRRQEAARDSGTPTTPRRQRPSCVLRHGQCQDPVECLRSALGRRNDAPYRRGGHSYLRTHNLSRFVIDRLAAHIEKSFVDRDAWTAHRKMLEITEFGV